MTSADVVVAGGGVIGASIAFHLASRGVGVVVCADGGGATPHSAAQLRVHHSDQSDARLAAIGLRTFESWPDVVGGDCGYRRTGFAFLAAEDRIETVTAVVDTVAGLGVESVVMSPREYAAEHPGLALQGVGVVAYEPRGGYADPVRTTGSLLSRAVDLGARIIREPVVALHRGSVETRTATVSTDQVVIAAGVHSRALLAGVADLPIRTRHIGFGLVRSSVPLNVTIDDTIGMYFRPHTGNQLLFGSPLDEWDLAPSTRPGRPAADRVHRALRTLATRLPGIDGAAVCSSASALDGYPPDHRAIIGSLAPGVYVATGFSGGGFKVAPAVGAAVADELITGGRRDELAPYRPSRFVPVHAYQQRGG